MKLITRAWLSCELPILVYSPVRRLHGVATCEWLVECLVADAAALEREFLSRCGRFCLKREEATLIKMCTLLGIYLWYLHSKRT
jgi:hypothetical protein